MRRFLLFIMLTALSMNACIVVSELDIREAETIIGGLQKEAAPPAVKHFVDNQIGNKAVTVDHAEYILSNIDIGNRIVAAECIIPHLLDVENAYVLYDRFGHNEKLVSAIKRNVRKASNQNVANYLYIRRFELADDYIWEPKDKPDLVEVSIPEINVSYTEKKGDLGILLPHSVADKIDYSSCAGLADEVRRVLANNKIKAVTAADILQKSEHCCADIEDTAVFLSSHLDDPENNHVMIESTSCRESDAFILETLIQEGEKDPQKMAYVSTNNKLELNVAPPELASFIVTECDIVLDSVKVNLGRRLVTSDFAADIIRQTDCCSAKDELRNYFADRLADPDHVDYLDKAAECRDDNSGR